MTNPEEQNGTADKAEAHDNHQDVMTDDLVSDDQATAGSENQAIEDMSVEELQAAASQAREEALKFRDIAMRAEAEMQNLRRRTEREVEHAVKYGAEKLVQNLLPIVDSLEKAVESVEQFETPNEATKAIIEGMGLCQKLFLDVLVKEGVEIVDPHGEPFDPNLHQAMSMIESPDMEPNSVVVVIQKGYRLNGRLVRPAMVMVSKGQSPGINETA